MAINPPAKPPNAPKVSGTRTIVSLIFLVIALAVCAIEMRAGLGQFLTLRSFNEVSEHNAFKEVSLADAQGMIAAFPSKSDVEVGVYGDVHHYYWYSLLRPLMGQKAPELYLTSNHSDPAKPMAVSFYTSIEDDSFNSPADPNSPAQTMTPGGHMETGDASGDSSDRPPLEETRVPAAADATATEPAGAEGQPAATPTEPDSSLKPATPTDEPTPPVSDATLEPATENEKSETPAEAK